MHHGGREDGDVDDFAAVLMSEERREWQDPAPLLEQVGVARGMTAVDMGCGPGFFTIPLARAVGASGKVYAVDSSARMLHHLEKNLAVLGGGREVVEVVHADVVATGIPDRCADMVLFANVLHDVRGRAAFASEAARIMKEGGSAVDIDWKAQESEIGPPLSIRLTEAQAVEILEERFTLERRVNAGVHHYGLVFKLRRRGSPSFRRPR